MASGLIIPDLGRRGIFYLCSNNKGADQLRCYSETDLCVCVFCTCKKLFFMARLICCAMINSFLGFQTRSDTNKAVHVDSL